MMSARAGSSWIIRNGRSAGGWAVSRAASARMHSVNRIILIAVRTLQQRVAPLFASNVFARFDSPALGGLDVDVFIAAIAIDAARPLLSEHDQIAAAGCAFGRRRDHQVTHQMR